MRWKIETDSDSADSASWGEIGWVSSWKNPSSKAEESVARERFERVGTDLVVGGAVAVVKARGDKRMGRERLGGRRLSK